MTLNVHCIAFVASLLAASLATAASPAEDAIAAAAGGSAATENAGDALRASLAAAKAAQSAAALAADPPTTRPVAGTDSPFYAELGSAPGVRAIVADFVTIMLADSRVSATFDGVDMDRLHAKLAEQFCVASGGPCTYTGKSMAESHEDMKVDQRQFNASVENLQRAMEQQGIASRIQNRLLARLAPTRRSIVTR